MNRFSFNSDSSRMAIGETDLHCGDCFQLRVGEMWHSVRIEHCSERGWIIKFPFGWRRAVNFEGYEARVAK